MFPILVIIASVFNETEISLKAPPSGISVSVKLPATSVTAEDISFSKSVCKVGERRLLNQRQLQSDEDGQNEVVHA